MERIKEKITSGFKITFISQIKTKIEKLLYILLSISSGALFSYLLKKYDENREKSFIKQTEKLEKSLSITSNNPYINKTVSKSDLQENSGILTPGF